MRDSTASAPTGPQAEQILDRFAEGFSFQRRSPILHTPAEYGLEYENVTFPSHDGVPLEGWYIPAPGSDKLIIANHPMGFNRSGEARDVVGSLTYARTLAGTPELRIGLFSRCMGASSTFAAMTRFPAAFEGVRCLVAPQPVTARTIVERRLALLGLPDRADDLERKIIQRTSIGFAERNAQEWARGVCVPTFLYQVRGDVLTDPGDVRTMFDNVPIPEKKLAWIEGTTARFDGYLEFQRRPAPMLDWFNKCMA